MRLYGLTKHRFVMVFTCFCVSFFVVLLIGILGPEAIGESSTTAKELGVSPKKFLVIEICIYIFSFLLKDHSLTLFRDHLKIFDLKFAQALKQFEKIEQICVQIFRDHISYFIELIR